MARFCTLCSSSSGNSTYIGTSDYGILIDAGSNCKQLVTAMTDAGIDPDSVKAIFLTHEHKDHVSALRVLASRKKIPVYATGGTLSALAYTDVLDGVRYEKILPGGVSIGDIHVSCFPTSHDAKESCGYRVEMPGHAVGVATDTGVFTDEILRNLCGCDAVLLESNYDSDLLDIGSYPLALKARIRSDIGHLSNDDCAEAVRRLTEINVRRFFLGHLSRENNTPERAYACTHSMLKRLGLRDGADYTLDVAPVKGMPVYKVI